MAMGSTGPTGPLSRPVKVLDARVGRTVLLAAIVVIVATLTTSSTATVSSATYSFRAASCHGFTFFPNRSYQLDYNWIGSARVAGTLGSSLMICDPNLPHKAIVTKVQFTLKDYSFAGDVRNCALVRSSLDPISAGGLEVLASVPATSYGAAPGIVRLTTSTISYATVDLVNHAYYVQCELRVDQIPTGDVGIFGVDVIYKITAGNG